MHSFLETICIHNGAPRHLEWHQRRVDATLKHFFPDHPHSWHLSKCIHVPEEYQAGVTRCRIEYDAHHFSMHYDHYVPKKIETLKMVEMPDQLDYRYKYADRNIIEKLYAQRENADDILIAKTGWITDTSMANIAFEANGRWYTPFFPLLAGTTWKRLVSEGIIIPRPIHQKELSFFNYFKVFNALKAFETATGYPVANIG